MIRFRVAVGVLAVAMRLGMAAACAAAIAGHAAAATPMVSAGVGHSIIVKTDGAVAGWGDNSAGQLGLGTLVLSSTPIKLAAIPAATAASAGNGHALVLAQDGTVWAWGLNTYGQLGDGTRTTRTSPVHVAGLSNVVAVAAGGAHSVALTADGTVWAWGQNAYAAIGDGTTIDRVTPVQVQGLGTVVSISAGLNHTLVLQNDGKVFAWGDNSQSQIDGLTHEVFLSPYGVGGMGIISAIAADGNTSFAVAPNGWVYWWGHMRNNSPGGAPGVSRINGLINIMSVSAGATSLSHALFTDNTGLAYLYFDINQSASTLLGLTPQTFNAVAGLSAGALGSAAGDDFVDPNVPIDPPGGSFAMVLLSDGTIAGLGQNPFGQLGNPSDQSTAAGVTVPGISNTVSVSCGNAFSMAVTADGSVWVWGDNYYGELGQGTSLATTVPVAITGVSAPTMIASGYAFNVALMPNGTAVAWGDNSLGQTGNGLRFEKQSAPAPVVGLSGITAVAAGMTHAIALASDGTIWSWGDNSTGELGLSTTASGIAGANVGLTAGQMSDFVDGKAVAAGYGFSLALKSDGTVWNWGADLTGQTGCVSFQPPCAVDPTVPRQISGLKNIVQIAAGVDFALALRSDGSVFAFGSNTNGQLGNGYILPATQNPAAMVTGMPPAQQIVAGGRHALAVLANGTIWSWGWNGSGQLGNGKTIDDPVPTGMGLTASVSSIGAGYESTYVVIHGGPLLAWGDNGFGELGDGTFAMRPSPVAVVQQGGTGNISTNDWYLIPDPTAPVLAAAAQVPPFLVQSAATGEEQALTVTAKMTFLANDAGNPGSTYVTASIPPGSLSALAAMPMPSLLRSAQKRSAKGMPTIPAKQIVARQDSTAADASSYVLVQQTPAGWQTVDNLQLIPAATGTLGSALATQNIMAGIDITQIPGAQFCVGYGASAQSMLANGTIRSVLSVPDGPQGVSCVPPSATVYPQAGVWWNPAASGSGFTIEYNGTNLFMAAYLYDASGRSTWYGAGPSPMTGSTFNAPLTTYMNGQTLTGTYKIPTQGPSPGYISITFSDPAHGTLTWPDGTIPIQRFEFAPNGLNLPPTASQPQTGWWWYPSEGGRGYSIEVQGNSAFIASYMYDGNGNPVWYASGPAALVSNVYQGDWMSYSGGQTLTGSYQPPTAVTSAGNLTLQFSSPTTGLLTLPDGRLIPIQRYTF